MANDPKVGNRVLATIKEVRGHCNAGHKAGEQIELSGHNTGGLCGFFYHDAFPYIIMLQFGGGFPASWGGPEVVELECMDRTNAVKMELKRLPRE